MPAYRFVAAWDDPSKLRPIAPDSRTSGFDPAPQTYSRGREQRAESRPKDSGGREYQIGSVLTNVFGASGQLMLEALLKGKPTAAEVAELARGTARKKIPAITEALESHRMTDHHRIMIRLSLEHMKFLEEQRQQIDREILQKINQSGLIRHFSSCRAFPVYNTIRPR